MNKLISLLTEYKNVICIILAIGTALFFIGDKAYSMEVTNKQATVQDLNTRMTKIERKIDSFDSKLDEKINFLDLKLDNKINILDTKIENKNNKIDDKLTAILLHIALKSKE